MSFGWLKGFPFVFFIKFNTIKRYFIFGIEFLARIKANGPAIWGGCVTRRSIRAGSWYFRHEFIPVRGGYGTCFCSPGTKFVTCWCDPGTSLIGAANLSPVTKLVGSTGAVSRYNLSRSKKTVK